MTWRTKSKLRSNAIKHGYRSGFEHKVSDQLKESKITFEYETTVIPTFNSSQQTDAAIKVARKVFGDKNTDEDCLPRLFSVQC